MRGENTQTVSAMTSLKVAFGEVKVRDRGAGGSGVVGGGAIVGGGGGEVGQDHAALALHRGRTLRDAVRSRRLTLRELLLQHPDTLLFL